MSPKRTSTVRTSVLNRDYSASKLSMKSPLIKQSPVTKVVKTIRSPKSPLKSELSSQSLQPKANKQTESIKLAADNKRERQIEVEDVE